MNQTLEQKAVEIIGQIQHLAPRATELAMQTARMEAFASVMTGVIYLVVFVALAVFWNRVY